MININLGRISHRFRDMASFPLKRTFLRATAECFTRLSHRWGVRQSHCGIVSKRHKLFTVHCNKKT